MNGCKIKGIILVMGGNFQARVAHIVGNAQLGHAAHARIMQGRSSIAVGEAQEIIKRCLLRSSQSQVGMRELPTQMTSQLHSQAH